MVRGSFKPLIDLFYEGEAVKKRAIITMFNKTQGSNRRMFNNWNAITKKDKVVMECKNIGGFFMDLNRCI